MHMVAHEVPFLYPALSLCCQLLEHFTKLLDQGLPTEARAYLGMLGFRIVMNYHGEVVGVEQPGMPDNEGDED